MKQAELLSCLLTINGLNTWFTGSEFINARHPEQKSSSLAKLKTLVAGGYLEKMRLREINAYAMTPDAVKKLAELRKGTK